MLDILLCDDEPAIRLSIGDALRDAGHTVVLAADGVDAMAILGSRPFDVLVCDLRLPGVNGMTVFARARQVSPMTDVILMTAYGSVSDAVAALKQGAQDYLTKPFDPDDLLVRIARIAERRGLEAELAHARAELAHRDEPPIVGRSPAIVGMLDRLDTFAQSDAPVLITGESGTGKELAARALHRRSPRRDGPFVAVNCAAFPETLIEAELFGHERGAFTGAVRRRDGRFKAADGGTLFLDEVAEIPLAVQAKLLRVLQDGAVEPLGANTRVPVDVRIISATHRNLKARIGAALFREDLYYRLNVLDLAIPPLRERRADLPVLVSHFLRRHARPGTVPPTITPRAWAALAEYAFPGNVRELGHAIEHAVVLARTGRIDLSELPGDIAGVAAPSEDPGGFRPLQVAAREFEREYLLRALAFAEGKRTKAAELLGISRKNLWEKLRLHGVEDKERPPAETLPVGNPSDATDTGR